LLDEQRPDHSKRFNMTARIGPSRFPPAWGRSKKESEQRAAQNAICHLRGDPLAFPSDDIVES
jgi:ribonuclease-3